MDLITLIVIISLVAVIKNKIFSFENIFIKIIVLNIVIFFTTFIIIALFSLFGITALILPSLSGIG